MEKNKLTKIRDTIEKMSTIHHIKFFEIIKKYSIDYSENRNGIFINMNTFNEDIINELNKYILYIDQQEKQLIETEKIKQDFEKEFFKDNKDKKDNNIYSNNA